MLVGDSLQGRVLDAFGQPLDGRPLPAGLDTAPLHAEAPPALDRPSIGETFVTGIRAVDSLLTVGVGQRLGVFAAARAASPRCWACSRGGPADVNVIALIGERGREVREFIEDSLGPEASRSRCWWSPPPIGPAMERARAALAATAIAEELPRAVVPA